MLAVVRSRQQRVCLALQGRVFFENRLSVDLPNCMIQYEKSVFLFLHTTTVVEDTAPNSGEGHTCFGLRWCVCGGLLRTIAPGWYIICGLLGSCCAIEEVSRILDSSILATTNAVAHVGSLALHCKFHACRNTLARSTAHGYRVFLAENARGWYLHQDFGPLFFQRTNQLVVRRGTAVSEGVQAAVHRHRGHPGRHKTTKLANVGSDWTARSSSSNCP